MDRDMNKIYDYKSNSNLVISNRRGRTNEPTGEGETLRGKIDAQAMGDRVFRTRPGEDKKKRNNKQDEDGLSRPLPSQDVDTSYFGMYRPKTRATKLVFEELLAWIQKHLGDQPRDVLHGAADEVLGIIKDDEMTGALKVVETGKLFGKSFNEHRYTELARICDRINDFSATELNDETQTYGNNASGTTVGVGVVFNDDDDDDDGSSSDNDSAVSVGSSDSSSSSSSGSSSSSSSSSNNNNNNNRDGNGDKKKKVEDRPEDRGSRKKKSSRGDDSLLSPHDIDGFWIQRELGKYYNDANVTQDLSKQVLEILQEDDERTCENRLVLLLEFDKFDLIKVLLRNRKVIMYCTRLNQAQTEEDRSRLEKEMALDQSPNGGLHILNALRQTRGGKVSTMDDVLTRKRRKDRDIGSKDDHLHLIDGDEGMIESFLDVYDTTKVKKVDLDQLKFASGDHTMTNKEVKLPKGSWRKQHKSYEEVHVPPLKPKPLGKEEVLLKIAKLPKFAQAAFRDTNSLNRVQSRVCKAALHEDFNLLICAPTGAGKTNVAMLTIMHEVGKFVTDEATGEIDRTRMKENMKIVYVAPMKALVQEVVVKFSQVLGDAYGINVKELSGDQQLSRAEIADTQIIVTTPEKWDIVTRKAGERAYTQLVKLVIIDEVHLLHNERGAVLEAIVARAIRQQELSQQVVRLVGVSATLPNFKDVATFLRVPLDRGLFFFDNSFRPCPLQQQYIGITERKPLKRFRMSNEICYEKVISSLKRNPKDQLLIFVHSRKETAQTAQAIRDMAFDNGDTGLFVPEDRPEAKEILRDESEKNVRSKDLKDVLIHGMGIHHAGMVRSDRNLVEELFRAGYIKALVCTATLAWGVNLPAHTVIIKGTQIYNPEKGRWTELSQLDILQMLGRAGRPQYDTEGEGIIITTHSELQYYLSLMNEQLPIESQLIRVLADSLNAELVMGTSQTIQDAARWLGYTYLYVRMLKNPTLYGIDVDEYENDKTLLGKRIELCHSAALLLDKAQLIRYDRRTGHMQVTPLGRIASHYYIAYDSMQTYNENLRATMGDIDLFHLFTLSKEFADIVVRDEEKMELVQLADRAPIPIKEGLEEPTAKTNILLQSFISGLRLDGFVLSCDLVFVHQNANRITRALFEICLTKGWARLAKICLDVAIMCEHRLWTTQCFLRQMKNHSIRDDTMRKLERHYLAPDQFFELTPQELGELSGGGMKMGRLLHKLIHCFPRIDCTAHVQPITRSTLKVELTLTPNFEFEPTHYDAGSLPFWIIVEDGDGDSILHYEMLVLNRMNSQVEHQTSFTVPLSDPLPPHYFCKIVCDRFLHAETVLPLSFRKLILPQRFPPPIELLDMTPLTVETAFNEVVGADDDFDEKFIKSTFKTVFLEQGVTSFNTMETQVFQSAFLSDGNVLFCASIGEEQKHVAELAIIRALAKNPRAKIVYVSPHKGWCDARFKAWDKLFAARLGIKVTQLSGETMSDLKRLGSHSVIVSTPEAWDNISRKWKQRKLVREVSLFIADQLHLVGSSPGPTFEIVVSRMRFMSSATGKTRIVGLGSSIANADDIAGWIGVQKNNVFNFHPSNRPTPLEVELRGFDINHVGTRLIAMARPTFDAVAHHIVKGKDENDKDDEGGNNGKKAIIFVPSRRQAKTTAVDILTFATSLQMEKNISDKKLFVDAKQERELTNYLGMIKEKALRATLEFGVGYIHDNLSDSDRAIVEACFEAGVFKVLVVVSSMCWNLPVKAGLVVIMDTSSYDGVANRHVDYPVTDILQMMAHANHEDEEDPSRCLILCHQKRKPYYRKFLHDPLPIESHVDQVLADHMNAEIVAEVVKNKQEAVDYLTWTLFYRRLTKNPNYYNLLGTDTDMLSDYLSELIENTLNDLDESKCIAIDENDMDVSALNLGMIAAHYYIQYTTIEVFASNIKPGSKFKRVMDVFTSAAEFEQIPVRYHEEKTLQMLARNVRLALTEPDYTDCRTKTHILLQLHFSRKEMTVEQRRDLNIILENSMHLLQALVDIIASNGWLRPALAAMELSQMIVQARWNMDSPLYQIPHFTKEIVDRCLNADVKRVYDIAEIEDDLRNKLLQLPQEKLADVAEYCNAYPDLELSCHVVDEKNLRTGSSISVKVKLERVEEEEDDDEDEEGAEKEEEQDEVPKKRKRSERDQDGTNEDEGKPIFGKVYAPFFPKTKIEAYWIVIGDPTRNALLSIKRVTLQKEGSYVLEFDAPKQPGKHELKVYLMCDAVLGADQVKSFHIDLHQGDDDDDDGSSSSSSSSDSE